MRISVFFIGIIILEPGLVSINDDYSGFFVDLFGLLRGWKVYENIRECRENVGILRRHTRI